MIYGRKKVLSLAIAAIIACGSIGYTQPRQSGPAASESEKKPTAEEPTAEWFSVKASTYKKELVIGEPVILRIDVTNKTENSFEFQLNFSLAHEVVIKVTAPDGVSKRYRGFFLRDKIYPRSVAEVGAHDIISWEYNLYYDKESLAGFVFEEPGEYTLEISMRPRIDFKHYVVLKAEPISIKTLVPSEMDRQALSIIANRDSTLALQSLTADNKSSATLQSLIEKFPDSTYAKYAEISLIYFLVKSSETDTTKIFEKSIAGYTKFVEKYPEDRLAETAMHKIALYYYFMEDHDKAREWLLKIKERFPDSVKLRKTDTLAKKLLFK